MTHSQISHIHDWFLSQISADEDTQKMCTQKNVKM